MLKISKRSNDGMLLRKERETGNEHGEWKNKNKISTTTTTKKHGKSLTLTLILSATSLPNVFLFLLLISRSPFYVLVTSRLTESVNTRRQHFLGTF